MTTPTRRGVVLIVEDHEPTRRVLGRILNLRGWDVLTAATVAEGMKYLKSSPDGIVLDLMLPDGDGEQVLDGVRAAGLAARVVVCTGVNEQSRLAAIDGQYRAIVLRKPVDADDVERAIRA